MNVRRIINMVLAGVVIASLAFGGLHVAQANVPLQNAPEETTAPGPLYLPLARSSSPYLVTPSAIGVDINPIGLTTGIYEFAKAGAAWVRGSEILWSSVEPQKGVRNWAALNTFDVGLDSLRNFGMQTVVAVRSTPAWAQKLPGIKCGPMKQEELEAFGDFMYDLVSRYSRPPRQVTYWEIWNEPDIRSEAVDVNSGFGCWGDPEDEFYGGGYYGQMLAVVYPRIKEANPNAQVIVGGLLLACDPNVTGACTEDLLRSMRFLEGVLRHDGANDGGQYFDGISFHSYDYYYNALGVFGNPLWNARSNTTGASVLLKADFLKNVLSNPEYGSPNKFLINTEQALLCDPVAHSPDKCSSEANSDFEQTKAYYLARTYAAGASEELMASFWFRGWGEWRNSQLLNDDRTPRPAYTALQVASKSLGGASPVSHIENFEGVHGFKFFRGDRIVWLLYSVDGIEREITLAGLPEKVYDVYGVEQPVNTILTVGVKPLYLEWLP